MHSGNARKSSESKYDETIEIWIYALVRAKVIHSQYWIPSWLYTISFTWLRIAISRHEQNSPDNGKNWCIPQGKKKIHRYVVATGFDCIIYIFDL